MKIQIKELVVVTQIRGAANRGGIRCDWSGICLCLSILQDPHQTFPSSSFPSAMMHHHHIGFNADKVEKAHLSLSFQSRLSQTANTGFGSKLEEAERIPLGVSFGIRYGHYRAIGALHLEGFLICKDCCGLQGFTVGYDPI